MSSRRAELGAQLAEPAHDRAVLLSPADLTSDGRRVVPPWWLDVTQRGRREAMELVMARWNAALPGRLARSSQLMQTLSAGVHLGRLDAPDDAIVLIYTLDNPSRSGDTDPFVCWNGYPPERRLLNDQIDVERLPQTVRTLYMQIHNGIRLAGLGPTGFIRTDEMFALDASSIDFECEAGNGRGRDPVELVAMALSPIDTVCVELTGNTDDHATGWLVSDATVKCAGLFGMP
jgi:hypothetical protein